MNRLLKIGFICVGNWSLTDNLIKYKLDSNHKTKNVLYSYISNGEIMYIGKTTMQLTKRMYGYQNAGPSQTTNIRVNAAIKELLLKDIPVDIFILEENGLLRYGDFKINLAAGLEDVLIYEISPKWNLQGINLIPMDINSEKPELTKNPLPTTDTLIPIITTFSILLGQTYYKQGFFNVTQEYSTFLGADHSTIEIQLGKNTNSVIQGYINRTANKNETPRIMGGKELRDWIEHHFVLNATMQVDVISPVCIQLYKI